MTILEKATYLCLIAVSCISAFLLLQKHFVPKRPTKPAAAPAMVGKTVRIEGLDWRSAPVTVVLQISTTCHYCADSISFYRKMAENRRYKSPSVSWIVLSREPVEDVKQYLLHANVVVDEVLRAKLEPINFAGTPALFIVDSHGSVRRAFLGRLLPSEEKDVLTILQKGTA